MNGDFRIGPWLVEPTLNRISRNGASRHLEPKVMQVLVCLAEEPGRVVAKQKLIQKIWAETFVTDDVLTRSISELRDAFGDDARDPAIIQTIPKQGYRLLVLPTLLDVERPTTHKRNRSLKVIGAVLIIAAIVTASAYLGRRYFRQPAPTERVMLAVLPLENLSGDSEQDYFSDGMTDELITLLGRLNPQRLGVIARTSAMQYKRSKKTVADIGREIGVDYVVEGSVRTEGAKVRIALQLIRVSDQSHVWSDTYDRDISHVLAIQTDIARQTARLDGGTPSVEAFAHHHCRKGPPRCLPLDP